MKKKISLLALLAAMTMMMAMTGCGGTAPNSASSTSQAPETQQTEETAESGSVVDTVDKDPNVFILGLDDSFPPMGYRNENNEIVGFDIDVAKAVCDRMGWTLELQPIDWDTKVLELNQGNIDAIWNGFTITEERKNELDFSIPYIKNEQVLVVMKDSDLTDLESLAGKKVALQAGSSSVDAMDDHPEFKSTLAEVVEVNDYAIGFMDLEQGGADALLVDSIVADYYINMTGGDYKVLDATLAGEEMGIGFRKGSPLCDQVNQCLREMKADGTLGEISTRWFGADVTIVE